MSCTKDQRFVAANPSTVWISETEPDKREEGKKTKAAHMALCVLHTFNGPNPTYDFLKNKLINIMTHPCVDEVLMDS